MRAWIPMNYSEVLPELFVGACPTTCEQIDRLRAGLGVSAVLNLQTDEDLALLRCDWEQLAAHYRHSKTRIRRVPIRATDSQDLRRRLPECVQALTQLLRGDHLVYVHCTAGLARAPSVVVTYLHWVQQMELERAMRHVTLRRVCSPSLEAIRLASEDLMG